MFEKFLFAAGLIFIVYGVAALIATWFKPELMQMRIFEPDGFTANLPPTRRNRSHSVIFLVLAGATFSAPYFDNYRLRLGFSLLFICFGLYLLVRRQRHWRGT